MNALPVVVDLRQALERLSGEEREARHAVVALEARLREFEDVERPAYERWLRVELGPEMTRVDEATATLRAQGLLADRVDELVAVYDLHPREALHAAQTGTFDEERDAVAARRQAKRDRKRAERRQTKRVRRTEAGTTASAKVGRGPGGGMPLTTLFRGLARRLHPDSPTVLRDLAPTRLRTVWVEVQAAYAGRNHERLLALSTWLDTVATAGTNAGDAADGAPILTLDERHRRLRALRGSRRALERRLTDLAADPAWGFPETGAAARRSIARAASARLADELTEIQDALHEIEGYLAAIGPPRAAVGRGARRGRNG